MASAEYVWLAGMPLAFVQGGAAYFVHADHLNTPQRITDAAAAVVWDAAYRPFGEATVTGLLTFNLRFPGQYYDAETALHYNTFRDYDPTTGRYIQSDPIGLQGGWNTYAYVGGNPVMRVDPKGLAFGDPDAEIPGEMIAECARDCADSNGTMYGVAAGAFAAGGKNVPKGGGVAGGGRSGPGTSVASHGMRSATNHARIPGQSGKVMKSVIGTNSVGGALGRFARPFGALMFWCAGESLVECNVQCVKANMAARGTPLFEG